MQLYIGNKNYSSWSMRPWVLMRQFDIPFDEVLVRFDSFAADSQFKRRIGAVSPTGRVPVLVDDGFVVWETLAIAEYLAERFAQHALWPRDAPARPRALPVRRNACRLLGAAQPLPAKHRDRAARRRRARAAGARRRAQ